MVGCEIAPPGCMLEYAVPAGGLVLGDGTPGDGPSWRKWVTRGGFIKP